MALLSSGRFEVLRNRALTILMLGHFTVDMYAGLLPVLYPLLTDRFELDLANVGLVSLAYSGVASVSQPLFGWLADRYGTRLTGLALLWTGLAFATIGFAPTFPVLLLLAAAAGLGSGAFHPFGALNASAVIPDKQRNVAMSIYVTGGTIGVATGPLVGAVLFSLFGMRGTALMALPGAGIALWLLVAMRAGALGGRHGHAAGAAARPGPIPVAALSLVVAVMMLRMFTVMGFTAFIPVWYESLGYGASFYGPLSTVMILASAVGAIGSGSLADRFGRREVMLWTLAATIPALLLFAQYPGPFAFVSGALVGLLAASTGPLLLVMAQQLMQGRAGVASGLILGLGFVAAAIGAPIFGALADVVGMQHAVRLQVLVVLATVVVAWYLPSDAQVQRLADAASEAAARAPGAAAHATPSPRSSASPPA
ncbi:MAG: MFS transporter [Chloroflexota bacterium]|nr:MFS transporter [Chloroflexota bacterium]